MKTVPFLLLTLFASAALAQPVTVDRQWEHNIPDRDAEVRVLDWQRADIEADRQAVEVALLQVTATNRLAAAMEAQVAAIEAQTAEFAAIRQQLAEIDFGNIEFVIPEDVKVAAMDFMQVVTRWLGPTDGSR